MKILVRAVMLLACVLFVLDSWSQSGGVVRDSITQEPVPFVNIWIEGETTGTTANEQGAYSFKTSVAGKHLVFSSIGYKKKIHMIMDNPGVIMLQPEVVQLEEVVVRTKKKGKPKSYRVGDEFRISEVRRFFFCDQSPYIAAKYFPYQDSFTNTPFLSALEIVTSSALERASFNIRLYEMDEHGEPGKPVYTENIIGTAKKGVNLTRLDLADKYIVFPKTGLLAAFEFLIVEQNKYIYVHTNPPDTVQHKMAIYTPAIGTVPVSIQGTSWMYYAGKWRTTPANKRVPQKEYEGKYSEVAIQLTLMD